MSVNFAISQLGVCLVLVVVTLVWGIRRYRRGLGYGNVKSRHRWFKVQGYLLWCVSGLIACSSIVPVAYLYTEHLWFESVGYAAVLWERVFWRWGLFGVFFIVALGFMNLNAAFANRLCPESREFGRWTHSRTVSFHWTVFILIFFAAIILAAPVLNLDEAAFRYVNKPVAESGLESNSYFGKSVDFYLFAFPLHRWVSQWVEILLWVTCVVVGLLYNFYYRRDARTMMRVKRYIVVHGSILWLMLLAVGVWRGYVNLWNKVYTRPLSEGLSSLHGYFYVDAKFEGATLLYCGILIGIGVAILVNLFWRKRLLWYSALCVWLVSYVAVIHIYPLGVFFTEVRFNPPPKEAPYIPRHIQSTREAFDLEEIEEKTYEKGFATLEMVNGNIGVRDNIQLWDRRVFYHVLRTAQIKVKHDFNAYTDVDRYRVGESEEYRQVFVAAREIVPDSDDKEWSKLKLQFTHGYGVCLAPVNEFIDNGLPNLWVKDVPIVIEDKYKPTLNITQPRIYYGELTHDYVIVNTKNGEYNIMTASDTDSVEKVSGAASTRPTPGAYYYSGSGGVRLGGWFRRLCFAVRFDFFQILLPAEITEESRIMFWRKIGTRRGKQLVSDRLSHIAPFLDYDPDPYIVIDDGQLWWIVDFYVTSTYYPNAQFYVDDTSLTPNLDVYAEPTFKKFNYIRNAGVGVINAYTGSVSFYLIHPDEPLTDSYQRGFTNLFKPLDEMPAGLRAHLRFPDYLTRIQAKMYGDYHIAAEDTQNFYNKTRRWKIPKETYYSAEPDQEMMPYYAMLKLPGETELEFVNIIPFTPPRRDTFLKAWLVARCDAPHYGERIAYILPTEQNIEGPTQVEADIEKVLSDHGKIRDWGAENIIRGNLHVIPIDGGIFYVEPIYLVPKNGGKLNISSQTGSLSESERSLDSGQKRPKLVAVAVRTADHEVAWDKSFTSAVENVFVGQKVAPESSTIDERKEAGPTLAEILDEVFKTVDADEVIKALENYRDANKKTD